MRGRWSLAIAGVILILAGGLLAHFTQTAGGIRIQDIRFKGAKGNTMSALLYIPRECDGADPGPRHPRGSRLHQFARDPGRLCHRIRPPRLRGAGARPDRPRLQRTARPSPTASAARTGWRICAASTSSTRTISASRATRWAAGPCWPPPPRCPNDYKSMVLEGSSTGKPFAAEGTASWPRNVALVFAQYEEFSTLMWGVDLARDVTRARNCGRCSAPKAPVEPGKVYGDIAQGTARVLYTPAITHPAEHISHRRSATASTGSPGPCRAARRSRPTTRSGSARRSAR